MDERCDRYPGTIAVRERREPGSSAAEQGAAGARNALQPEAARAHGTVPYFGSDRYDSRIPFVGTPDAEVLATLAGAVIDWEVLRRESMERMVAVQEAERGRIARDLHDEFGHFFASVMERLSALQDCDGPTARQVAADIRSLVREGIQVARSVAWSLRPSGLDDLGLFGCVEQYVEDCRHIYPIRIELTTTGQPPIVSSSVATAVFRIVQEALTNVGRHSGASEASVMVIASDSTLRAVIEDNGKGFDAEIAGQRRSLGLIGMRDRARLAGGRLCVESRPGQGTTIMAELPIPR